MKKNRSKNSIWLKSALLLLVSLMISLTIAEVAIRAIGYKPHNPGGLAAHSKSNRRPLMTEDHSVLHWVNKPGKYVYPGYSPEVESISVTILPDGSRVTNAMKQPQESGGKLIMTGDSFTMGYAISDNETFAWKLQEQFPERNVVNMGVPGYSTYQSLLMLEDLLPRISDKKPITIIYGYIDQHQLRNVLHPLWMAMFAGPTKRNPMPPYATIDASGKLVRHTLSSRRAWPFRESSALVARAELAWINFSARERSAQRFAVTNRIILDMQELTDTHGARLIVLLLEMQDGNDPNLIEFLESNDIDYLNCDLQLSGPEFYVAGEGHPSGRLNSRWASCIGDYLRTHTS